MNNFFSFWKIKFKTLKNLKFLFDDFSKTAKSQRELYEKSIELNKFYIDTALMSDQVLADIRLDLLPGREVQKAADNLFLELFDLFAENRIALEETGEILSGDPTLIERAVEKYNVDFEFWKALLR